MRLWREPGNSVQPQAALLAAIALLLILLTPTSKSTISLAEGSLLLLADFENDSGDPETAPNLKQLLKLSLSQSQLFVLYPDVKIQAALRRMKQNSNSQITFDTASQICIRDGIPAFLLPQVGRLAGDLIVNVRLVIIRENALREVHVDTVRAPSEGELLIAMDDLGWKIRRFLGEKTDSSWLSPSLRAPFAAGSAEALRFFVRGLTLHEIGDYDGEITLLRQAILADPRFAAAHLRLADILANSGSPTAAVKHLELAEEYRAHLSPKEQCAIRGAYYSMNQQYAAARKQYEQCASAYPTDWSSQCRLAQFELQMRSFSKAVSLFEQAIKIPDAGLAAYLGLCRAALMNQDAAMARRIWNQALSLAPKNPDVALAGGYISLVENDLRSALEAFRLVQANSSPLVRSFGSLMIAQAQIYAGRLNAALATLEEGIRGDQLRGYQTAEIDKHLLAAQVHLLLENPGQASEECGKINPLSLDPLRSAHLGILFARMGKIAQAQLISTKAEASDRFPMTRPLDQLLRGEILLASAAYDAAIDAFSKARALAPGDFPSEPLARALVATGRWEEAEKVYRLICERKAELLYPARTPWFSGTWTQALFELGKCLQALQRNQEAQQYFRNYLWVMDGADADLASMRHAKVLLTQRKPQSPRNGRFGGPDGRR